MAAVVSLSRLSHSTQGALSTSRLSHHPLLFQRRSQICQDIGFISAIGISPVMDLQVKYLWGLTPVASASLEKVQMFPNMEKLSMRIGCSGSRERTFRVSAFISASAAEINFEHASSLKDIKVVTPICERPAVHITCLEDLLQWVRKAQQLAASVEQQFYDTDGGPDSSDLLRELDWLLDDSLAACCQKGRDSDAFSQLNNQTTSAHVLLRISIEELENQWVQRVKERRPFQYIVGCAHWRDLVLSVQEGVLIPRPETEQMIDLAEAAIMGNPSLAVGLWADLGTGSGAIAIALARLLPSPGSVLAVDMSETAVAVARRNVGHYALTDKVNVVHGSWFLSLEDQKGSLAGVISNPPYIPSANIAALQAEVGKHEPRTALDGGQDGMKDLRQICHGSARALRAGGFLALETNGGTQAEAVADLLRNMNSPVTCFQNIKIVPDFAGICRFVTAIHC
ncbi:unnamed protein product [Sphagnum troendelagicum]|uniref:Methyltransferase small domain-containing protein n=1 Tax=Sphagnum troendelagicum TaxID=128251 RepID=A0ABP0V4V1_9BRYO